MSQKIRLKRSCSNCVKGSRIAVNDDILCREKGAVSADYVCSGHRYIPGRIVSKERGVSCMDCENFILNSKSADDRFPIGLCRLFSVRQFNGLEKKACSKFAKKVEADVS